MTLCDAHGFFVKKAERDYLTNYVEWVCFSGSSIHVAEKAATPKRKPSVIGLIMDLNNKLIGLVPEESLVLRMSLVPKPLHTLNLRKAMTNKNWASLRNRFLEERGHKCEICEHEANSASDLDAHEVWEYRTDKRPNRATLTAIKMICKDCHSIVHFGLTMSLAKHGKIPMTEIGRLKAHFCAVNKVNQVMFDFHANASIGRWDELSRKSSWRINLATFHDLLDEQEKKTFEAFATVKKSLIGQH